MRIGLDARTIYRPARRGIGKSLIHLYQYLLSARPGWQVVAYHRQTGELESLLPTTRVKSRLIEMIGDRFDAWQRLRLPAAAWRDGVDLLHCPANTCSFWMPTPTVVTIHDLIPLDMPEGRPAAEVRRDQVMNRHLQGDRHSFLSFLRLAGQIARAPHHA